MEHLRFEMDLKAGSRSAHSGSGHGVSTPCANQLERRHPGGRLLVGTVWLLLLLAQPGATVQAQEAVRMSMAGEAAAQAHQNALVNIDSYNLHLGPTLWRFGAGLGLDYQDNVTLVQNGQQGDFVYRPNVNTQLLWPITDKQSLNFSLGAGYWGYFQHSALDRAFITPNSDLSFDIYVGDFRINLHDRFSISEYSYQDPSVVGSGGYSQLQNSLGVSTLWDLNRVVVKFGYDHASYLELTGGLGEPDFTGEIFSSSAGYMLKPAMLLGLEVGGGLLSNSYTNAYAPYTDATEWNVGSFFQSPVSDRVAVTAHGGYTVLSPEANGALKTATEFSGVYVALALTHRVNRFMDYSLSGGRTLASGLFAGSFDMYTANLAVNWRIIEKATLSTSFLYQRGSQLVLQGETFEQYGPQISLSRAFLRKWSSSLRYQFYVRDSNVPGQDYTLNVVSLDLTHQF
jgi:hypothetical protein